VDSPKWKTEGYWSQQVINLGDKQEAPNLEEVITAANRLLA
jgi:heptosyltransferase-1